MTCLIDKLITVTTQQCAVGFLQAVQSYMVGIIYLRGQMRQPEEEMLSLWGFLQHFPTLVFPTDIYALFSAGR